MAHTVEFRARVKNKQGKLVTRTISFKAKGPRPVPGLDEASKIGTCVSVKQGKRKGPAVKLCKAKPTDKQKKYGLTWRFKKAR